MLLLRLQNLQAQFKGQQGDFSLVIQPGFTGQAARIPDSLIQIVPRVEELEEIHSSEVGSRLHSGAFHLHTDGALSLPSGHLLPGFPVRSIGGPGGALYVGVTVFIQYLMKEVPVFVVDRNAVRGRRVMVAAALVPQGFRGNDDAAVLNPFIQNTSVSKEDHFL